MPLYSKMMRILALRSAEFICLLVLGMKTLSCRCCWSMIWRILGTRYACRGHCNWGDRSAQSCSTVLPLLYSNRTHDKLKSLKINNNLGAMNSLRRLAVPPTSDQTATLLPIQVRQTCNFSTFLQLNFPPGKSMKITDPAQLISGSHR